MCDRTTSQHLLWTQLLPFAHPAAIFFFFNDTATTEIYTLSLHDALPISARRHHAAPAHHARERPAGASRRQPPDGAAAGPRDQKPARRAARRGAPAGARPAGGGDQGTPSGHHR